MTLRAFYTVEKGKPFTIHLLDEQGKLVSQLATHPTSAEILSKYLPSQIAKTLSSSAPAQAAANQAASKSGQTVTASAQGFSFSRIAYQSLLRFPMETFSFFVSLGAIVTYDLMQNAAANPMGYQQLIDSQLDPVGQLGFFAFMLANGAATQPFMQMIQQGKLNPRLTPFVTYGGMSIGMVASNIVHEIGHWPGLGQCAKELWSTQTRNVSKNKYENCDKAAAEWGERGGFGGISNQWAPGLISLIGSALLASAIQGSGKVVFSSVSKGFAQVVLWSGKWTWGKVVQIAAIEVGLTLLPAGGVVLRGVRAIGPTLNFLNQVTLFNWITHLIEIPITRTYNNLTQSHWLKELDSQLAADLLQAKEQSWSPEAAQKMTQNLQEFSKQMQQWRQMNLNQVLMAQSNWEQKLAKITMMYRSSQDFYMDFLGRIWERQYGRYKDSYASGEAVSILDRNFPLNGVIVAAAQADDETTWLEAPDLIEERQIQTIHSVVRNFKETGLTSTDQQKFDQIKSSLLQNDRIKLGQALERINCLLRPGSSPNCKLESNSSRFSETLMSLRKSLGEPKPIWQSGVGYLIAYNITPTNKALIDRTLYGKNWDYLSTPSFGESMVASMFYGPDAEKGQSSVVFRSGFADIFKAPRIKSDDNWSPIRQPKTQAAVLSDVFNTGIYQYLNKGRIRSSILNADRNSFRDWWKKYPETDYMRAWLDYEKKYQANIALMIKSWNSADHETINRGPIANSVLKAFQQEIKFYLMVLGELQKDQLISQMKNLPAETLSSQQRMVNVKKSGDHLQILSLIRNNSNLDFSTYMKLQGQTVPAELDLARQKNLKWQDQTLEMVQEILGLFDKLQVKNIQIPSGEVTEMPVSTLDARELQEKADVFRRYLNELQKVAFSELIITHESQMKLAQVSFKAIEKLLSEMQSYAEAVNAVSYIQRHGEQGFTSRRCNLAKPQTGLGGMQAVQRAAEGC